MSHTAHFPRFCFSTRRFAALGLAATVGLLAGVGCDAEEGDGDACTADAQCKGDRICDMGMCISPDDIGDDGADGPGGETGDSGGDGPSSDSGSMPPGEVDLAEAVVGGWSAAGTVSPPGEEPFDVSWGWFLCADQRMAGFSEAAGFTFVEKGNYTVSEAAGTIEVTHRSKDTSIGDIWGPDVATLEYDPDEDTLTFTDSNFGATLFRIEGTVTNDDCDPSW